MKQFKIKKNGKHLHIFARDEADAVKKLRDKFTADSDINYNGYKIKLHSGYNTYVNMRDYYEVYAPEGYLVGGAKTINSAKDLADKDKEKRNKYNIKFSKKDSSINDSNSYKDELMDYLFYKKYRITQQHAKSKKTGDDIIVYTATNNKQGKGIQFGYNTKTHEIEVVLYRDSKGIEKQLHGLGEIKSLLDSSINDKLIESGSEEALQKNIATEIEAGKDPKQAAAIAYSVQRKNDAGEPQEKMAQKQYEQLKAERKEIEDEIDRNDNNPRYDIDAAHKELAKIDSKIKELKNKFGYALKDSQICDKDIPHITKEKWSKIPADYKHIDPKTGKRMAFAGSLGIDPYGTTLLTEGEHFIIDESDLSNIKDSTFYYSYVDKDKNNYSGQVQGRNEEEARKKIESKENFVKMIHFIAVRDSHIKDGFTLQQIKRIVAPYNNTILAHDNKNGYYISSSSADEIAEIARKLGIADQYTYEADGYFINLRRFGIKDSKVKDSGTVRADELKKGQKIIVNTSTGKIELEIEDVKVSSNRVYLEVYGAPYGREMSYGMNTTPDKIYKLADKSVFSEETMNSVKEGIDKDYDSMESRISEMSDAQNKNKPKLPPKGKWVWDEVKGDWFDTGAKMYYEELGTLNLEHLNDDVISNVNTSPNDTYNHILENYINNKTYKKDFVKSVVEKAYKNSDITGLTKEQYNKLIQLIANSKSLKDSSITDSRKYYTIGGYKGKYDPKALEDIKKAARYNVEAHLEKLSSGNYQLVLHGETSNLIDCIENYFGLDASGLKDSQIKDSRHVTAKEVKKGDFGIFQDAPTAWYYEVSKIEPFDNNKYHVVANEMTREHKKLKFSPSEFYVDKDSRVLLVDSSIKDEKYELFGDVFEPDSNGVKINGKYITKDRLEEIYQKAKNVNIFNRPSGLLFYQAYFKKNYPMSNFRKIGDKEVRDAYGGKTGKDIKRYFDAWGYPSKNELQSVVDYYKMTKQDVEDAFGWRYDKQTLDKLKCYDSSIRDVTYEEEIKKKHIKGDYLDSLRKMIIKEEPNTRAELRKVYNKWARQEHGGLGYDEEFREMCKEFDID